jgi:hypothetical protein
MWESAVVDEKLPSYAHAAGIAASQWTAIRSIRPGSASYQSAMTPKTPGRACIFCGSRKKIEHEHVWPDWLVGIMEEKEARHVFTQQDATGAMSVMRAHTAPAWSTTARVVCKQCNGGWMSRLEDTASVLLKPMILDRRRTLERFVVPFLAMWALKTAMTLDQATEGGVRIPPEHPRLLFDERWPLRTSTVFIGRYEPDDPLAAYYLKPNGHLELRLDSDPSTVHEAEAYGVTMLVGHLVFHLFASTLAEGRTEIMPPRPLPDGLIRIWPAAFTSVAWPPARDFHADSYVALETSW